jgi:hypothetical protein
VVGKEVTGSLVGFADVGRVDGVPVGTKTVMIVVGIPVTGEKEGNVVGLGVAVGVTDGKVLGSVVGAVVGSKVGCSTVGL